MSTRRITGRWPFLLIAALAVAFLSYPSESTVVPTWKVRVVDESGSPLKRARVTEYWSHNSFESREHDSELVTDDAGYVTFPRQTVRASLLRRGIGGFINRFNVHGVDVGPHAYLVVAGDMNSTTDNSDYVPGKPLPVEVVLRRLK